MRRPLLATAAAVLAMASGTAGANPPLIFGTTCGLLAVTDVTGQIAPTDVYTGVIFAAATGVDLIHPTGNPTTTTITCTLKVDGVVRDRATTLLGFDGPVVLEDTQFTYIAETPSIDYAEICTTITSADTSGSPSTYNGGCRLVSEWYLPPDEICDLLPQPFGQDLCDISLDGQHPLLPVELLFAVPDVVSA